MRNAICFSLATSLLLMTPAIGSTGDHIKLEDGTMIDLHKATRAPIDWSKWEKRGERVQKIGGGILVIIQIAAYALLLKR